MTETKNNILETKKNNIFNKAIEAYKKYEPRDDKDKEQFANNCENFEKVFERVWEGVSTINLQGEVKAEMPVKYLFENCKLPVTGQIDLCDKSKLIEIKTKWRKRTGKYKNDGTPSFSIVQPKSIDDYFLQTNFYALATGLKPYLLVANENEFQIYDESNCDQLKPENRKKYFDKIIRTCQRRERLAARHEGKQTWTQDIELNLNTFYWDQDHRDIGEELWNTNL